MCCGCYKEAGSPTVYNDKVARAVELIENVYTFHGAGGNLHIVVDDYNLEDGHINFCLDQIMKATCVDASAFQLQAELECARHLLSMTQEERYSAMGLRDGCWKFGAYLKACRIQKRLLLVYAARRIGIDVNALSRIERGLQSPPPVHALHAWCHALELPESNLKILTVLAKESHRERLNIK